jgi:hypothetical protein
MTRSVRILSLVRSEDRGIADLEDLNANSELFALPRPCNCLVMQSRESGLEVLQWREGLLTDIVQEASPGPLVGSADPLRIAVSRQAKFC